MLMRLITLDRNIYYTHIERESRECSVKTARSNYYSELVHNTTILRKLNQAGLTGLECLLQDETNCLMDCIMNVKIITYFLYETIIYMTRFL